MSKDYRQHVTEDRRLVILRILAEMPGYGCNSSIITDALDRYGHRVSRDHVHTDLAWLEEQELVGVDDFSTVRVATATQRGVDVAEGRAHCPGVKRPGPGG